MEGTREGVEKRGMEGRSKGETQGPKPTIPELEGVQGELSGLLATLKQSEEKIANLLTGDGPVPDAKKGEGEGEGEEVEKKEEETSSAPSDWQ